MSNVQEKQYLILKLCSKADDSGLATLANLIIGGSFSEDDMDDSVIEQIESALNSFTEKSINQLHDLLAEQGLL